MPGAVRAARLEVWRTVAQARLPSGEHGLRIGILDPAVGHQDRVVGQRRIELEGQTLVLRKEADETVVDVPRGWRPPVLGGGERRDVRPGSASDSNGAQGAPEVDWLPRRWDAADGQTLVQDHVPAARQVEDGQSGGVQVDVLLHRLG